jgi:hypothetical protein
MLRISLAKRAADAIKSELISLSEHVSSSLAWPASCQIHFHSLINFVDGMARKERETRDEREEIPPAMARESKANNNRGELNNEICCVCCVSVRFYSVIVKSRDSVSFC